MRIVVVALTVCGVLLAVTGIAEQAFWNGKILWFFVPEDWGTPRYASFPRASGPFVDPDHFANYLGMIFPLAAGCSLFGLPRTYATQRNDTRLVIRLWFGFASFVILAAIALSFSRALWLLTGLGIIALCWFRAYVIPLSACRSTLRSSNGKNGATVVRVKGLWATVASLMVGLLILISVSTFLGRSRDSALALRLGQTVSDTDFGIGVRPVLWRASNRIFKDYLLTGAGLGTWAEIFPHYEAAPRLEMAFHQAHNDYLQMVAEVGIPGLITLMCVILWLGSWSRQVGRVSFNQRLFLLSLSISIAVMLLHETVDFAMHIPANAFVFVLLLALAVRTLARSNPHDGSRETSVWWLYSVGQCALVVGIWVLLAYLAIRKQNVGYPADIQPPTNLKAANELISQHPASASAYMERFTLSGARNWPVADVRDLESAVWLDPTNAYSRDLYAAALEEEGAMQESSHEITVSLYNAPDIASHFYLAPASLKGMRSDQREAVEEGLVQAIASRERGAVAALAQIHETLGDFSQEAALYDSAAAASRSSDQRTQYYDLAGQIWIKAGRAGDAVKDLRRAVAIDSPGNHAYADLINAEVSAKESFASISATIESAVNRGANAQPLWTELAFSYQNSGDRVSAEKAWLNALKIGPSYDLLIKIGRFYLTAERFDLAAAMFQRALEMAPDSGAAYCGLGASDEGAYEYFQAEQAYGKAAQLVPADCLAEYEAFQKRMMLAGQIK
ncbi:MAG TPA: O-antigen ligase family protein [Candidatus Binataceae bacterium]|nr:O-antigen ligase family protein [Candidatus Binataceae bacterium]